MKLQERNGLWWVSVLSNWRLIFFFDFLKDDLFFFTSWITCCFISASISRVEPYWATFFRPSVAYPLVFHTVYSGLWEAPMMSEKCVVNLSKEREYHNEVMNYLWDWRHRNELMNNSWRTTLNKIYKLYWPAGKSLGWVCILQSPWKTTSYLASSQAQHSATVGPTPSSSAKINSVLFGYFFFLRCFY